MQVGLRAEAKKETVVSQSGLHLGNESASVQQGWGKGASVKQGLASLEHYRKHVLSDPG